MLTPKQLRNHNFQLAGRNAYRSADVDTYMEEVYQSYDQMFRENAELVKKLSLLADKVSEYKKDEDNIRNALLMAERMKDSILAEAQDKAKTALAAAEEKVRLAKQAVDEKTASIIENAEKDAAKIVRDANERASETLKLAQSNATKILARAQEIYDEQVNTVKDEAEKEREYLNQVKEESAEVRQKLMETYKRQIELLEFTPDFSEEVKRMHMRADDALSDTETEEELEADTELDSELDSDTDTELDVDADIEIDDEPDDESDAESDEPASDPYAESDSDEEAIIETFEVSEAAADHIILPTEDDEYDEVAIVAENAPSIDKYLGDDDAEFEDIDSGRSFDELEDEIDEYAEENGKDYDEDADYEKTVYAPTDMELDDDESDNSEFTLFKRNED